MLAEVWRWITENPDLLSDYGTFASALTALVVATITLKQLALNRKQLEAAREQAQAAQAQVDAAYQQAGHALEAIAEDRKALRQSIYARMDAYGPSVSVLHMGEPRTAITEEADSRVGEVVFGPENHAELPKYFAVRGGSQYGFWDLNFSGRLRIENHGTMSALVSLSVDHRWSGEPMERDATGRYVLEAGEKRDLVW